jgi:hypothetical protein
MAILTDITELEGVRSTSDNSMIPVNPPAEGWVIDYETQQKVIKFSNNPIEVLKDSVFRVLLTRRDWWLIYSSDYGQEFDMYFQAHDSDYIVGVFPTLVKNTLLVDDRILTADVTNISVSGGILTCDLMLNTVYGEIAVSGYEMEIF